MNNKKEVKQRIKNLEKELALLKASIECPTHPPQRLPYSIDVLVDKITNNTLPEDLVVGDYIDVELYTGEVVRFYVVGTECDKNGNKTGEVLAQYFSSAHHIYSFPFFTADFSSAPCLLLFFFLFLLNFYFVHTIHIDSLLMD